MNKSELIVGIAKEADTSKSEASRVLGAALKVIADQLRSRGSVRIVGFGTFTTRKRKASTGRNPRTGAPIAIKETVLPIFKAGKALKDEVTKKK